jgi:hypothetical protein
MRVRLFGLLVFGGVVAALGFAATAGAGEDGTTFHKLRTSLIGAEEAPDPGDPNGRGTARLRLNRHTGMVCWKLQVRRIVLPAVAAHIHLGSAGVAGDVVVTLGTPNRRGKASGCTTVRPKLVRQILRNPEQYYVNVHNDPYPAGAVRGQLG